MKTKFNFKKNIFSNTYKIYEVEKEIGFLKKNCFSTITIAELNGYKFLYKEKGFFDKQTDIINSENKIIGKINYSSWSKKAFLKLFGNKISWQYVNAWNTRFNIEIGSGKKIEFSRNGNINADRITDNEIEILSALYIYNHYQKATFAVLFIMLAPTFLNNIFKLLN